MVEKSLDAAALRDRLEALDMNRADLARLTGRKPSIVTLWCNGRRRIPAYVINCLDLHEQNRRLRRAAWKATAVDSGGTMDSGGALAAP